MLVLFAECEPVSVDRVTVTSPILINVSAHFLSAAPQTDCVIVYLICVEIIDDFNERKRS